MGTGGLEDEIDLESTEASVSQKKKLIQEVECIKEQFRKGKLTQEEVIDRICELYRIEDYGSKIIGVRIGAKSQKRRTFLKKK